MCVPGVFRDQFDKAISLRMGIEKMLGDKAEILYAKGANFVGDSALESRVSTFGKPTYRDNRPHP